MVIQTREKRLKKWDRLVIGKLVNVKNELKKLSVKFFLIIKQSLSSFRSWFPSKGEWRGLIVGGIISLITSLVISLLIASHYNRISSKEFSKLMRDSTNTMIQEITSTVENTTQKSTEEIVDALIPNDFSLVINNDNYAPGSICEIKTKTREIEPYFMVRNNSKYPAKDVTLVVLLDTTSIKEETQTLMECFHKNGAFAFLEMESWEYEGMHFEGRGFIIPAPIYPGKQRTVRDLKFNMIKDETVIIIQINRQHRFFIKYKLIPNNT